MKTKAGPNEAMELALEGTYGYAWLPDVGCHVTGAEHRPDARLVLDESAVARLASIRGWLVGLWHAGEQSLANKLAEDIDGKLEYLANYGEMVEVQDGPDYGGDQCEPVKVPRYRVLLGDDGTFNGFSIAWYHIAPQGTVLDRANTLRSEGASWESSRRRAIKEAGVNDDLSSTTFARRKGERPEDYPGLWGRWMTVHYKYDFNGGLLYHGPGRGEVFAVHLGERPMWSIHT